LSWQNGWSAEVGLGQWLDRVEAFRFLILRRRRNNETTIALSHPGLADADGNSVRVFVGKITPTSNKELNRKIIGDYKWQHKRKNASATLRKTIPYNSSSKKYDASLIVSNKIKDSRFRWQDSGFPFRPPPSSILNMSEATLLRNWNFKLPGRLNRSLVVNKGPNMKLKNKIAPLSAKSQSKNNSKDDRGRKIRRRIWMQLAAVFLIIVFLASECATLLPVE
jgi:hypothetical protein